ncbi:unnamed protein product [Clonostachys solani]|uniref:Major facilitator superfamily (MFS) profile domain-containing protein n=1 Tax=Clonostachys solani TaxID=160281 RepID=A0A9P0ERA0_9HYPO|nr:unnamed protein product [Clonostachys solani]
MDVTKSDEMAVNDGAQFNPGRRFMTAFFSLCILVVVNSLDATALGPAIPTMSYELGGSAVQAFWAGTSFLLAGTVAMLTFGGLSQSFGRKALLLISIGFFAVGSIITATAEEFTRVLIGRSIQGTGGGAIMTMVEILITDLVPLRHRGTYFGYQSAAAAVGTAVGPLLGGGFTDTIGWEWIFWINVPLCVLGFVAVAVFLKLHKVHGEFTTKMARFDWPGVMLLTAPLTGFLVSISWGGILYSWSSWQSIVPMVLGLVGLLAFIVYEAYVPSEPLVRLQIFHNRTAMVSYLGTTVHGIVTWCLMYYLPLYYQLVLDMSATMSGVAVLPETLLVPAGSIVVGVLVSKWGTFRWAIWCAWCLTVLGFALLYLMGPDTKTWQWILINVVPGVGIGMLYSSLAYGTLTSASEKDAAYAASMYIFSRALGQSIGVAAGGAILQAQLAKQLAAYPELADRASSLAKEASSLVEYVKSLEHGSEERIMIVQAYAQSLSIVWATMAGLAGAALLASLLTQTLGVDRAQETEQGFRHDKEDKTPGKDQVPQQEQEIGTKTTGGT